MSEIKFVGVCGAGSMGAGIAQVAAQSGATVVVFDSNAEALQRGKTRIEGAINKLAAQGKIPAADARALLNNLTWSVDVGDLAKSEIVIEAIIEDLAIKSALFAKIEGVLSETAIIASNTSSIPISRLASSLKRPERFIGMHFFNPAPLMKLVEIIPGSATSNGVTDAIKALAEAWKKVGVVVADVPGFIVNRVARPFYGEAFRALLEGAGEAQDIDEVFRSAGFRMGPLELTDLIGQDINFAVARSVYDSYFGRTRFYPQQAQAALVDAGWLGRKTGRGVYRYDSKQTSSAPSGSTDLQPSHNHKDAAQTLISQIKREHPFATVSIDGVSLGFSQGRMAATQSRTLDAPAALLDWFDPAAKGVLAYAATSDHAAKVAQNVIAALGRSPLRVIDRPGLLLFRTLGQLVNSAADAALECVGDEAGIDAALRYGANYPFGLFAWADKLGRACVADIMANIASETGSPMYAPSEYLRRTA